MIEIIIKDWDNDFEKKSSPLSLSSSSRTSPRGSVMNPPRVSRIWDNCQWFDIFDNDLRSLTIRRTCPRGSVMNPPRVSRIWNNWQWFEIIDNIHLLYHYHNPQEPVHVAPWWIHQECQGASSSHRLFGSSSAHPLTEQWLIVGQFLHIF